MKKNNKSFGEVLFIIFVACMFFIGTLFSSKFVFSAIFKTIYEYQNLFDRVDRLEKLVSKYFNEPITLPESTKEKEFGGYACFGKDKVVRIATINEKGYTVFDNIKDSFCEEITKKGFTFINK